MSQSILGTPLSKTAKKIMMLGCGELGKEVVIELQRMGVEVIGVDRYDNAPGMQVAHRSHTINMLDGDALREVIELEKPDLIVPEIEAIATASLLELESEGFRVIPTARAARLTMDREGIRLLAAESLNVRTSPYRFAEIVLFNEIKFTYSVEEFQDLLKKKKTNMSQNFKDLLFH